MSTSAHWPAAHAVLASDAARELAARVREPVRASLVADDTPAHAYDAALLPLLLPCAAWLARRRSLARTALVVGLSGAQGTGKTTLAEVLRVILADGLGLRTLVLSLDDLYLTRAEREQLAANVHPLLRTRGVPGTHAVALGTRSLAQLRDLPLGARVRVPRFDKADDDRAPETRWREYEGPIDCVIFEGWCVGARAQTQAELAAPINALERERDADGRFRRYVNAQLAGAYRTLFDAIDVQAFIAAPDLASSLAWRTEQEQKLRAAHPNPRRSMSAGEVAEFVQFYERISRSMLLDMPAHADVVLGLDRAHAFDSVQVR